MKRSGAGGDKLELELLGYEFPRILHDEWDSNWLKIRISAANVRGSWSATDASLTTFEVAELAGWLRAIAQGQAGAEDEIAFTEPNLSFELVASNKRVRLRAWFELELRPRWARSDEVPARDLCVDLEVSRDDLRAAAESLDAQLLQFPRRAVGG